MAEIDWVNFMTLKPEFLSERKKEELYSTLVEYVPEYNLENKHLIHFVRILQEVLKLKGEQVYHLTNELDEIAATQGKNEGDKLNRYLTEIEVLQKELKYYKELNKENYSSEYASDELLKREIIKLEIQNEELLNEHKKQEKDLLDQKEEVEKLTTQVSALEREKQELSREFKALQDEIAEKNFRLLIGSPESDVEKQENLIKVIKEKNKHISQLLEDIEYAEDENLTLKAKLADIKDELSETTIHITEITSELFALRNLNNKFEVEQINFSEKIKSLMLQIEELTEEKNKTDKCLDEYIKMFNTKLNEWKDVLDTKEEENQKLKEEIKKVYSSPVFYNFSDDQIKNLNLKIAEKDKEINVLQQELTKATEEINSSVDLIEELREKNRLLIPVSQPKQKIECLEEKITLLEEKLSYAEADALMMAEEISTLVVKLREYETGVFGLPEALVKIEKLEKQLQGKILQNEELIEICNNLEIKLANFEEQSMSPKVKSDSDLDKIYTTDLKLKHGEGEKLLGSLRSQLEKKDEELLQLKLKYHKAMKFLKSRLSSNGRPNSKKSRDLKSCTFKEKGMTPKIENIYKENEALRKGMHEILESIREQDCSGLVEVQSECLERLLEALDSRHVCGWYHPAMRLQAQLNSEEGKNEELRNQIRSLKTEEKKKSSELQNAYLKIQSLEKNLIPYCEENETKKTTITESESQKESEITMKRPNFDEECRIIELESELQQLRHELELKKQEIDTLTNTYALEKENLMSENVRLESMAEQLKAQPLDSGSLKLADLTSQIVVQQRKIEFFQSWEGILRKTIEDIRGETFREKETMLCDLLKLQNDKSKLLHKIDKLEKEISDKIPKEEFQSLKQELTNEKAKYQRHVNLFFEKDESNNKIFEAEIDLLQKEKEDISTELKLAKEKLIAVEELSKEMKREDEISCLTSKLAVLEVQALEERKKVEHLEELRDVLKAENQQLEARNKDLVKQLENLMRDVENHKEVEKQLRSKELERLCNGDYSELLERNKVLERNCENLKLEKENIQELFEISQGQCRTFQEWKNEDKILLNSLNEQILMLEISNDDKVSISKLSHELTSSRLMVSQLSKKNQDLELRISKVIAQNVEWEMRMTEKSKELIHERRKILAFSDYLSRVLEDLINVQYPTIRFRDLEEVLEIKAEAQKKYKDLLEKSNQLKLEIKEYSIKKEEMEIQLNSLENLKLAFKGESQDLIRWHNKSTDLRMKEAKIRQENEYLVNQIAQMEGEVKKLSEELARLEQENENQKSQWEMKQKMWEKAQMQLCELIKGKTSKKSEKKFCDSSTETENLSPREPYMENDTIQKLKAEICQLRKEGKEKDEIIKIKEDTLKNLKTSDILKEVEEKTSTFNREALENPEREALKVTIQSFQNIIKQKEETILRYQNLLKEARENYGQASAKSQLEIKKLNETLASQTFAYNKLKNETHSDQFARKSISIIVEKYLIKINELEEEVKELQIRLSDANKLELKNKEEICRWKTLADERLSLAEDVKRRIEEKYNKEVENYREEIHKGQREIERLNQCIENNRSEYAREQPQVHSADRESSQGKLDNLSDCTFDKSERIKSSHLNREVELLKEQLSTSKMESSRLKEQIRRIRRPKSTNSSGTVETLTEKINNLEQMLAISKEREKEMMELNQKKLKSAEEVVRWDERKKSQQTIQQLAAKLKEKETEVEMLKNKNESFRNLVYKCEKDKNILQMQLKSAKGSPEGAGTRIEKLEAENLRLESEIECLKNQLREQERHSGGLGAALLEAKLEEQERKLAAFELAAKGQNALIEEIENMKAVNLNLEKSLLKLESENLALRLKLEKEKVDLNLFLNTATCATKSINEMKHRFNSQQKKNRMSTRESSCFRGGRKDNKIQWTEDKWRQHLARLEEDHELLKAKYAETLDRNEALEKELNNCRYRLHLMEEKDLAEVVSKSSNIHSNTQLSQELFELKRKVAQKTLLLNRVKSLLLKTGLKEKALQRCEGSEPD